MIFNSKLFFFKIGVIKSSILLLGLGPEFGLKIIISFYNFLVNKLKFMQEYREG